MLYATIQCLSAAVQYFLLGRHGANGGYIAANLTLDQDIHCGDAYNDICIINCSMNVNFTLNSRFPHVYCGNTTKCIINCSGNSCLRESHIYANHTKHLQLISHEATNCVRDGYVYLPDHGNATIIGDSNGVHGQILRSLHVYSGTDTDRIDIECNDAGSDTVADCNGVQIDAQTAQYLSITINGASFEHSTVYCPTNSRLSPSCIINADSADATTNLQIYAQKGMPQDIVFYSNGTINGDYSGTTIICHNDSSVIHNDTFFGTPCFFIFSLSPTVDPTTEPTIESTVMLSIVSTVETDVEQSDDTSKGTAALFKFLSNLPMGLWLFILIIVSVLTGCCVVTLYILLKKQRNLKKHRKRTQEGTTTAAAIVLHNRASDMSRMAHNILNDVPQNRANDVPQMKHIATNDGGTPQSPPLQLQINSNKTETISIELPPSHNEENIFVHNNHEDNEVNIVVSSHSSVVEIKADIHTVVSQSISSDESDESSSSFQRNRENNKENVVTKGATTQGKDTDSDSSFSTSSVKGGITDLGDMVLQVMDADHQGEQNGEVGEDAHDGIFGPF